MKKALLGLVLVSLLTGCSTIGKLIPSKFDNVEYGKLVELNVISTMAPGGWCQESAIQQMNYRAVWLQTYSKYRLNENIAKIYEQIGDITKELNERENPSEAYCRIKRENIHKITAETLQVFGGRRS